MSRTDRLRRLQFPKVYVFTTPHDKVRAWEGAREGVGLVKVGYTTHENVETRIWQQFPTKTSDKQPFEVLLAEPAVTDDGRGFSDKDVHRVLRSMGACHVNGEWFEATVDEVRAAIQQVASGKPATSTRLGTFAPRPEQQRAIELTADYFSRYSKENEGKAPHFLWNAKMRFGKTFAAYKLAERMDWKRILILTYKPAVRSAWQTDLESHQDFAGWQFHDPNRDYFDLDMDRPIVWFASFQDVLGKNGNGQIKEHNEVMHLEDWDVVILDEYHFGAWNENAKELYDGDVSEKSEDGDFSEATFPLTAGHYLYLSGTPFRALANGEFVEEQIFNWTYPDEQAAKERWSGSSDQANPYEDLPQMVMMTYQLPPSIRDLANNTDINEFDLSEFFRAVATEQADGSTTVTFKYETQVQGWLDLIRGQHLPAVSTAVNEGGSPPMPYQDVRLLETLRHTIWFLPNVNSCHAMANLLAAPQNRRFYGDYKVVVAAGTKAGIGAKALPPVVEAMGNPFKTKTITLTCGKLMTGITVAPWTGIFMLRSMNSPETYFQSAFRVQSPWTLTTPDPTGGTTKSILKDVCYIFDFDPNRALRQVSEYSTRLTQAPDVAHVEQAVADFLYFLPVLCYDGFSLQELKAGELLDIVAAGTASTMLARRWQSAQLVNVDNATLERLLGNEQVLASLEKIEAFRSLSKSMAAVISSEKSLDKVKREKPAMTPAEQREYDNERKANKKWRTELREKLLKFLTRVPIFMYLTDAREQNLQEVILNVEPDLFTTVTGLTVDDFRALTEIGVFNSATMNAAIFAFRRFEEASLTYAGERDLASQVGGWDITLPRGEADGFLAEAV